MALQGEESNQPAMPLAEEQQHQPVMPLGEEQQQQQKQGEEQQNQPVMPLGEEQQQQQKQGEEQQKKQGEWQLVVEGNPKCLWWYNLMKSEHGCPPTTVHFKQLILPWHDYGDTKCTKGVAAIKADQGQVDKVETAEQNAAGSSTAVTSSTTS